MAALDGDAFGECDTILVQLSLRIYYDSNLAMGKLEPIAFSARVKTDTSRDFVSSLDHVCVNRARRTVIDLGQYSASQNTMYSFKSRFFMWHGVENGKASIAVLSDEDIQDQLHLMAKRGWRDYIEVEMLVNIIPEPPESVPNLKSEQEEQGES